jgi:cytochrome c peroxidase
MSSRGSLQCRLCALVALPLLLLQLQGCHSGRLQNSSSQGLIKGPTAEEPLIPEPINRTFEEASQLKVARSLPDYKTATADDFAVSPGGGQVSFSWDMKLRFVPRGYMRVLDSSGSMTHRVDGIGVTLVNHAASTRDPSDGRTWFSYSTGNPMYPDGVPLYRQLMRGKTGDCVGQTLYEIPVSCSGDTFEVAFDEVPDSASGAASGTGLTHPWHSQIVPNPGYKINPYPSDATGAPAPGNTNFMTYQLLYLGSVVGRPVAGDRDFDPTHPLFTNNNDRNRFVTGLGQVVVETTVAPGNHRIPNRIVSAGLRRETFSEVRLANSGIARGIEPSMPTDGNFIVYQSFLAPTSATGNAGIGHGFHIRRVSGSFDDPRCRRTSPCTELRFSNPEPISGMHTHANDPVPGMAPGTTFGSRYALFRHQIGTPTLDHVYAPNDSFGIAYPWVSPDGNFLLGTADFGTGGGLDTVGLEYCLNGNECNPVVTNPNSIRRIRRGHYQMYGDALVADLGTAKVFQAMTLDSPLNEHWRTLARVTAHSSASFDGLWGPALQHPVSHLRAFKGTPGTDTMPLFVTMNNFDNARGALSLLEFTSLGNIDIGQHRRGYLFYSGLQNVGTYTASGGANALPYTGLVADLTKSQDVSGNNLAVAVGPGAFFPFNDPAPYTGPLGANERQLHIGRVGQGAYCSSDGGIRISENPGRSRAGALSSYSDRLSVQLWVKPLQLGTRTILAQSPVYSIVLLSDGRLEIKGNAVGSTAGARPYGFTVRSEGTLAVDDWTHLVVDFSIIRSRSAIQIRVHANGKLALRTESNSLPGVTRLVGGPGSWSFCAAGAGNLHDKALIIDEIGIAPRLLSTAEIRAAALIEDPRTAGSPAETATLSARLGPLLPVLNGLNIDVDEAHVPADNPITEPKFFLGNRLFFDKNLSSTSTVSCASCHSPAHGYGSPDASGRGRGVDGQLGARAAPRIVNLVFGTPENGYDLDERASSLEEQVIDPFVNPREMGMGSMGAVLTRVRRNAAYANLVQSAFGKPLSQVTELELRQALATFIRTLVVGDAPYDRFRKGDASALTEQQKRGYGTFVNHCVGCHGGHALSNRRTFNIGAYPDSHADRGKQAVTGNPRDALAFMTPGLRDMHRRTGLGHDGTLTLQAILASYNAGGFHQSPNKGHEVRAMGLDAAGLADLEAFLTGGLRSSFELPYTFTPPTP